MLKNSQLSAFIFILQLSWVGFKMVCAEPMSQTNTTQSVPCSSIINSCQDKTRCTTELQTELGETPPNCYCDKHCSALNDCCSDYVSVCDLHNHTMELNTTKSPYALLAKNWKCYQYNRSPRTPGIWMISSCPASFTDNDTRSKCEEAVNVPATSTTEDFLSNVPTTECHGSECVTFRNLFCARCNGFASPIFWKLSWRCNIRPRTNLSVAEESKFLVENCPGYSLQPHDAVKRRYCFPIVSNCAVMQSDSKLKNECAQGPVGLVYYPKNDRHYRNPSCLLCNGGKVTNAKCGPSEFSTPVFQPKSFEMVLQFESYPWSRDVKVVRQIRESCGKYFIYDPYLEECRAGVLPDPMQSIVDIFRFKAWLKPLSATSPFEMIKEDVLMDAIANTLSLSTRSLTVISVKKDENSIAVTFDVKAITANKSAINSTLSVFGLKKLLRFESPFNVTISGTLWSVFKITHRRMACSKPEIYPPSNFTQRGSKVIVNNQTTFNSSDVYLIARNHSQHGIQAGSLFVCRSFFTEACAEGQVLLELQPADYILVNDSLLFVAANTSYDSGQFELDGTNAWVCTNYTNVTPTEPTVPWVSGNRVLWYFTVCGLSMSIVCLFVLLVTYLAFKELRTMPGKNLMSLATSLLLCHFMWLLGSGDTDNPVFCKVTAVILHYVFLVSFACTTVIAYDTRRAFPKNTADMSNILFPSASKQRHIAYLSFSWGVPLVFVVTCVVIDQQGTVVIGYGNAIICWLTDMQAQIIFFGVPIGLMLLYNLVAFIFTVQAIRAAKIGAKQLHRQGASQGHEIKIYFRLMTLMGFTWFFGFGAHALHQSLMYPFVVLTSLHGVYLAFAFAFKPYVFNLYRNRLADISMQSRKSTISTIDLTTSIKGTPSKEAESVL